MEQGPWWAALTTWVVVNTVNLAQAVGFASRSSHRMAVNHVLGLVIAALAIPATRTVEAHVTWDPCPAAWGQGIVKKRTSTRPWEARP